MFTYAIPWIWQQIQNFVSQIFEPIRGQEISKCPFGAKSSSKKSTKNFPGFLPFPRKWGHIQKIRGLYTTIIRGFYFDSLRLLFWFELFLEAREKFSLVFLEEVLTPKGHLEINWLLVERFLYFVVTIGSVEVCNVFKNAVHQIRPQISFLWINITVMPEGEKYWGCQ